MNPAPGLASGPITLAVTGATGLIGSALVTLMRSHGHTVRRLVRSTQQLQAGDALWNPEADAIDPAVLEGCSAIVHLAGEPIARRWTAARKQELRASRIRGTTLLARTVSAMAVKPTVVVSGSAVGYYGDRGDEVLDERSAPGSDFLATVVKEWEAAAQPIADAGVRLVVMRSGIVLSPRGGALAKLLPPFRLGLGGPIGSGRQWMSWISLSDHLRAIQHAIFTESLTGPANFVAPNPVPNAAFATTLGRVLMRPAIIPVPAFALQLAFGEMAEATILAGQRVLPTALVASGFEFTEPTLEGALRAELRAELRA